MGVSLNQSKVVSLQDFFGCEDSCVGVLKLTMSVSLKNSSQILCSLCRHPKTFSKHCS